MDIVTLENPRFTPYHGKPNPGGSIFRGYLFVTCVVAGALDDGGDLEIGMPDLQVRTTAGGIDRIEFPKDHKVIRDSRSRAQKLRDEASISMLDYPAYLDKLEADGVIERKWVDRYFPASKATRDAITALAYELRVVKRALAQDVAA